MKIFSFEHKDLNFIDFKQMILKWTEDETVATIKCMSSFDEEAVTSQQVSNKSKVNESNTVSSQKELFDLLQKQQEMLKEQQKHVWFFKRITPTVGNYEDSYDRTNIFNKAVRKCPEAESLIEGQPMFD